MDSQENRSQRRSRGGKLGVIGVLLSYILGRIIPGFAVKRLVRALGSGSEETRSAAYMALVKLGPRNADRLLAEAKAGHGTAGILQALGDMGDRHVISSLEEFTKSANPKVADAARESIELLKSDDPE
jgi:HEAT repeat protein